MKIEVKLLADCPHYILPLATLWFNELGKQWIPEASVGRAIKTYEQHLNKHHLPLTFVAIQNEQPIAMVSLRENDGIRDDLTPWLGSLIVHPDYRQQGIGEKLIEVTKNQARDNGHQKLYLFALDPTIPNWYQALGWKFIAIDKFYHHPVTVMAYELI